MDPVSFSELLHELRSVNAETVDIPVERLTPGCVIASGTFERHIVTALPYRPDQRHPSVCVPVRHLHGGHSFPLSCAQGSPVRIYRARMRRPNGFEVPVIPRVTIPDAPQAGDRVVLQPYIAHQIGVHTMREFNGTQWEDRSPARGGVRLRPMSSTVMREVVRPSAVANPDGWFVYLPAGQRPYLYADGVPVLARIAASLVPGDVVRLPGRGRLQVQDVRAHADGRTIRLRVLEPSSHEGRHLVWASREGDAVEVEDSGRSGMLYPCEPRDEELISASDLYVGDTVIAASGLPYCAVATVDEVWRQPVREAMHVHSTTTDGRHVRTMTGFDRRYVLLRRMAVEYTAGARRPVPAHAY